MDKRIKKISSAKKIHGLFFLQPKNLTCNDSPYVYDFIIKISGDVKKLIVKFTAWPF
jgi:hypothetical protein